MSCETPEGETWCYRYDPFGRRLTKVRKLLKDELAWAAQKYPGLVPAAAREVTKIWTWPKPPVDVGAIGDKRPPIIGTLFTWDDAVIADEVPLRLDGTIDWLASRRWHFEPDSFRPLGKQTSEGALQLIANDHLGTPHEMFDDAGLLTWAASYTTWGLVRRAQTYHKPANESRHAIYTRSGETRGNLALKRASAEQYDCPIRFQGQWAEAELQDVQYNRSRFYDPQTGQFTSLDPLKLGGGLRIAGYVDTPSAETDPFGLSKALVPSGDAAYNYGNVRNVAGYEVGGNAGRVGDTYNVNIWGLYKTKDSKSIAVLVRALKAEAKASGAKNISIQGISIVNPSISNMNPALASRMGLQLESVNPSTIFLRGPVQ